MGSGSNYGTVFSVSTTGGALTLLASFNGTDGEGPNGSLTVSGATIYGTTEFGGGMGNTGTVFSLPTGGGTPTLLGPKQAKLLGAFQLDFLGQLVGSGSGAAAGRA
jgi:uncharacterized repeat protein (TIGR03803 family)